MNLNKQLDVAKVFMKDIPVGANFFHGGIEYIKQEEIGATGGSWCYCAKAYDGMTLKFMWNSIVFINTHTDIPEEVITEEDVTEEDITEEDIVACWGHRGAQYLAEVLSGDYPLDTAREDIKSLIGSKYDTRQRKDRGHP
jgi:hypothetical protein